MKVPGHNDKLLLNIHENISEFYKIASKSGEFTRSCFRKYTFRKRTYVKHKPKKHCNHIVYLIRSIRLHKSRRTPRTPGEGVKPPLPHHPTLSTPGPPTKLITTLSGPQVNNSEPLSNKSIFANFFKIFLIKT